MKKRWIIVFDEYEGLIEKAIEILSGTVSGYVKYVLQAKRIDDISDDEIKKFNIITLGQIKDNRILQLCEKSGDLNVPCQQEGYSIYVGASPLDAESQIIAIAGYDDAGVLYGCIDFCNKYCGHIVYQRGDLFGENYFDEPFNVEIPSWKYSVSPAIKTRAIWTWGHVIYDYKNFFENMLKLRLNEIVIWNDFVPLNAKKVVEYAHSLGIKVIWGFAWGWGVKCDEILNAMNEKSLQALKENVLKTYQTQYADVGGDGIYFQSFTELNTDNVGGKCIAEIVTELVNDISGALFERYPDLHIQFGLHATSVKTHLDILQKVDNRICIVWEDCGAFPYDYSANKVENFDETVLLVKRLLTLRGEMESFGSVLKGMLKLDWELFEHFSGPYILGERTNGYLKARQKKKDKIWKLVQSAWLKNADYARKMIATIAEEGKNPIVQALVEDSMFENKIVFPVALYAEMLWTPMAETKDLAEIVANYPCVEFVNV